MEEELLSEEIIKDKAFDFLNSKIGQINENNLKGQLQNILEQASKNKIIVSDYCIKNTRLPRKLKKKYKKERIYCFDICYRQPRIEITIPIEESES